MAPRGSQVDEWEIPSHLWKSVVEHVPIAAVLAARTLEGEMDYVNPEFTRVTGYSLTDVPTVSDWILRAYPDPVYRETVLANWSLDVDPALMGRDVSYDVACKDGSKKRMLLRASMLGNDRMIVTMLDVTRQYEAEEALRRSESRYRALVESCPVPILLTRDGPILFVNSAAVRLFGAETADQLIGRSAIDFVHPDCLGDLRRLLDVLSRMGVAAKAPYRAVRLDGTVVDVEAAGVVTEFDGETARLVAMYDVTERNEAERKRRRYEETLQHAQRVESLGLLAAGVAHDFNNILVGILGSVSLALTSESSGVRSHLERIESSARRAADLATQMLACSGQANAKLEVVELGTLLRDMQPVLRVVIRDPFRIELDPANADFFVLANPTQVRQILLNLVSNAAEAVRGLEDANSGKVSVRVFPYLQSHDDPPPDLISGTIEPGAYVVIEVADDGPGIGSETLPRIFEPFFSTKLAGRGLGLAAVHGILRAHNGAIAVHSEPGLGSTFRVYLHAAGPARETASSPPAILEPTDANYLVLVIDDESIVLEVMGSMLEALGCGALRASTVEEGKRMFVANGDRIGLVIVDMNMPDGDGLQLCKAIHAVRPNVPVVLSSGLGNERMADLSRQEGFAAFLPKPFELRDLESVIEKAKLVDGGH